MNEQSRDDAKARAFHDLFKSAPTESMIGNLSTTLGLVAQTPGA